MSDFREEEALGKVYDTPPGAPAVRLSAPLHEAGWSSPRLLTLADRAARRRRALAFRDRRGPLHRARRCITQIPLAAGVRGLGWMSLLFLATLALGFAFQYLQVRVMQKVGQETMYDLRKEIFAHLQRLPMSFYDRSPVGRLVTRVTTDVDALNDLFASGIAAMVNDAFLLRRLRLHHAAHELAAGAGHLRRHAASSSWPPGSSATKVRDANRRIRTAIARINAFLQEHISGMSVVQLFNRERKSREQFAVLNRMHMEAYKDAILAFALFYPARRIPRRRRHHHRLLVRRPASAGRRGPDRRADRLHAVRPALLPADSRPQRQIQYSASRHGRLRAHLQAAR